MKLFKIMMLFLAGAFMNFSAAGQANATINILTLNSGQVNLGCFVDVQVSIGNTGPTAAIGANKVRAAISVPIAIASPLPDAQQTGLPAGWVIVSNLANGTITVCNGSDIIPVGEQRQIFIKVKGTAVGGPSTIAGALSFGPGTGVCTGPGSLPGDNTADNTSTSSIQVIAAPACSLGISASAGTIACNGGTTTLTATASGANGAVEYSLTGGAPFQSGNTFTVAAGTYTVTAREVGNPCCTSTANAVTITQPPGITASASAGTIACNGETTTLTVTATGGAAPLQYSLNGGAFQSANTFTVNAGGSPYTVTVKDANQCTATTNAVAVNQPAVIAASASAGNIICNGGTTTLTVTTTGGVAPLQYSLNGGAFQSANTFTVNAGGSPYTVTVKDANLCAATTNTVTVTQPAAISASASAGTIACNGGTTALTVTATGGTAPLQYSINGGAFQSANTFTVNAGGSPYIVTIKDANLCAATTNAVTVTQPTALTATATSTPVTSTGGSDGTASANPAGGTAPYSYLWSPGGQTGQTATGLAADTYTVTVTDSKGCITAATTTVGSPSCNINALVSAGNIICNGGTTTLIVTTTGGVAPLQYSLNGGAFQSANTFTVNAGGSPYTVTVKDANLCAATTNAVTVTQPAAISASASAGTIACNGGITALTVTATGGTAPLQYSINGGAFQSANTFTVNAGGSPYIVTIKDANLCAATTNVVTVTQPTALTATATSTPVTTTGGSDGTATANPAGGTAPYSYLWSPGGQTGQTATGLASGTYTVTVTDSKGCITTATTTVGSPSCNINALVSAGNIICNGGTTTLIVTTTGGVAPLQYSLNGGAFQSANTFTVNAGGSPYIVTVKDAAFCTTTTTALTITAPPVITATASTGIIACNNGTATLTIAAVGGTTPFQYSINGGAFQSPNTFIVGAGTYTVTVKDANSCTGTTAPVTVTLPATLIASATAGRITQCGGTTIVKVMVSGGTSPYTGVGNFTRGPGTWSFPVIDAFGCTDFATIIIEAPGCMDLKVYPNPTENSIKVNHSIAEPGSIMQVFDMNGVMVLSKPVPQNAFLTTIDVSRLAAGSYILVYLNGNEKKQVLFVKITPN